MLSQKEKNKTEHRSLKPHACFGLLRKSLGSHLAYIAESKIESPMEKKSTTKAIRVERVTRRMGPGYCGDASPRRVIFYPRISRENGKKKNHENEARQFRHQKYRDGKKEPRRREQPSNRARPGGGNEENRMCEADIETRRLRFFDVAEYRKSGRPSSSHRPSSSRAFAPEITQDRDTQYP